MSKEFKELSLKAMHPVRDASDHFVASYYADRAGSQKAHFERGVEYLRKLNQALAAEGVDVMGIGE